MTPAIEQLAAVQARICLEQARQERWAQQLRALRRAARKERAAERRLIRPGAAAPNSGRSSDPRVLNPLAGSRSIQPIRPR